MKHIILITLICISLSGYTQTISGGNGFSIMLCEDNLVWTVGSNAAGQLGDNTTIDKLTSIEVMGLTDVVDVQAGLAHSLVLKSDGTVWNWGDNTFGQLGNGTTNPSLIPIEVTSLPSDIVKIIAGGYHNIAITSDSITWMWGNNQFDQINGSGSNKLTPIATTSISNIVNVAATTAHTSVLYSDSTIAVWNNYPTSPGSGIAIMPLVGIFEVSAGDSHLFALKNDNTVWAWGDNQYGQLGDGTIIDKPITPVQITGLSNIISIAGGQRHSIALKSDGTVWTWGWNGFGQLGNNTLIDELTPIQVPGLDSVIEISAGSHHSIAKRSDSTIWVWGNNGSGQLGNDTATNTTVPVQMMLSCIYQCPAPQIYSGGNLEICSGDSVQVFGTYQQTANTYYDSLLTPNGCDSIIQISLTVNSLPTVSFTGLDSLYCTNSNTSTLTGLPSGGIFSGSGVAGGVFNPLSTGLGTFTINYSYTDANGCIDSQSQSVTVTNCTGIEGLGIEDFKIYPNPSTGIINIQPKSLVYISNILGEIIFTGESMQIDLSEYGKGIYFVRVGATIKKLVLTY